jgi:hypothetical protein
VSKNHMDPTVKIKPFCESGVPTEEKKLFRNGGWKKDSPVNVRCRLRSSEQTNKEPSKG